MPLGIMQPYFMPYNKLLADAHKIYTNCASG